MSYIDKNILLSCLCFKKKATVGFMPCKVSLYQGSLIIGAYSLIEHDVRVVVAMSGADKVSHTTLTVAPNRNLLV